MRGPDTTARPRVALAGFQIESVSFLPKLATLAEFERVAVRGDDMVKQLRGTNTAIGGFIEVCERNGLAMYPIVFSGLGAVGPATDEAVDFYQNEICHAIAREAEELDGVLLFLHGAAWSPSYPDPEARMIAAVRRVLGPDKPLMVALDYHGNIDAATLKHATAAFAYHCSPHTDMAQTGVRAAECLVRTLRGEIRPVWAIAKPHVLVPSIFSATALEPLATVIAEARTREREIAPRYLDISILAGFSYGDAPNTGFAALCVADDDQALAEATAEALSRRIWRERRALYTPVRVYEPAEAIAHVQDALVKGRDRQGPYVLLEHADRMNDSTYLLAALLDRGVRRAAVPFLWDAAAARAAQAAGVGNTVRLQLGGHSSAKAGPPLDVVARVLWAGEKRYQVSGSFMRGARVDLGITALLDIEGISVSVVSAFAFAVDDDPFRIFGLDLADFDIVVLRSKTHFRAFYESVAAEILIVDTPDYGVADLRRLPYRLLATAEHFPFNELPALDDPATAIS